MDSHYNSRYGNTTASPTIISSMVNLTQGSKNSDESAIITAFINFYHDPYFLYIAILAGILLSLSCGLCIRYLILTYTVPIDKQGNKKNVDTTSTGTSLSGWTINVPDAVSDAPVVSDREKAGFDAQSGYTNKQGVVLRPAQFAPLHQPPMKCLRASSTTSPNRGRVHSGTDSASACLSDTTTTGQFCFSTGFVSGNTVTDFSWLNGGNRVAAGSEEVYANGSESVCNDDSVVADSIESTHDE